MEIFLEQHLNQLKNSRIPNLYWETLHHKLENEIFDAGTYFMIQKVTESDEKNDDVIFRDLDVNCIDKSNDINVDYDDVTVKWRAIVNVKTEINHLDDAQIYLIDHAWTYRPEDAKKYLTESKDLLSRMFSLIYLHLSFDDHRDSACEMVLENMWKFNQTYSIANENLGDESAVPIWYIMDELGCSVEHSDNPNVSIVPFCYIPTMTTYSIMWPLRNLNSEEPLFRDYLNGQSSVLNRKIRLLPWFELQFYEIEHFEKIDYSSLYNNKFLVHTSLPSEVNPRFLEGQLVKVYSDVDQVVDNLSDSCFQLVNSVEDADVVWLKECASDFKTFSLQFPNKYLNQFPFEMLITVKNMLAIVSRRLYSKVEPSFDEDLKLFEDRENINDELLPWESPIWLPITFDLNHELQLFVYYFYKREERNLENYWIIKPYNLARSLDTHITNNLIRIIRLIETGPKIASKYISKPVLLYRKDIDSRVKFDLRFVVLLKSVKPLQLFVHEKFIVRVANKKFEMNNFDDYEQHFTVMNYKNNVRMKEISCEDFVALFDDQYKRRSKWDFILQKIRTALRKVFEAASLFDPPRGIAPSPQSRAIYGADVMLRWVGDDLEPVILEMNYGPDNTRLFKIYSDFYNQIFGKLFRNQECHEIIEI